MITRENEDGSVSYTLSPGERTALYGVLGFLLGRQLGYRKGRLSMAKEIRKTGITTNR